MRTTIRKHGTAAGLVVGGVLAGAVLSGTLSANAASSPSPTPSAGASAPAAPNQAAPDQANPNRGDLSRPQRADETLLTGDTAAKVKAAVLKKYPGATVVRMETDSDGAYEAHITKADGTRTTVELDKGFAVTGEEDCGPGGPGGPGGRGPGGPAGAGTGTASPTA